MMKKRKVVRLTESDLHSIIRNAVKRIIKENEAQILPDDIFDEMADRIDDGYEARIGQIAGDSYDGEVEFELDYGGYVTFQAHVESEWGYDNPSTFNEPASSDDTRLTELRITSQEVTYYDGQNQPSQYMFSPEQIQYLERNLNVALEPKELDDENEF